MSTPVWPFTENPFDNGTKGSFKKMYIISINTANKLWGQQSNPELLPVHLVFAPVRQAYGNAYTAWKSKKAAYKGATAKVYKMLKELSARKAERFDALVRVVYPRRSSEYKKLFPARRNSFQKGAIDERISELAVLIMGMGDDPALASAKDEVIDFHNLLVDARNEQKALEGIVNTKSSELEHQRIICAQAMYAVLGDLMHIYRSNSSSIAHFFDLVTLRGAYPDDDDLEFEGFVNAMQVHNIVHDFSSEQLFEMENLGTDTLFFYTAGSAVEPYNGIGIVLNPGQKLTVTIAELGGYKQFLNVFNQSETQGSYRVTLVEE
jgi:hypothetical protein